MWKLSIYDLMEPLPPHEVALYVQTLAPFQLQGKREAGFCAALPWLSVRQKRALPAKALGALNRLGLNTGGRGRSGPRATQKILYLWIFLRLHGQKHTDISVTQTKAQMALLLHQHGYLLGGREEGEPVRVRGQLEKSPVIKSLQLQGITTEEPQGV